MKKKKYTCPVCGFDELENELYDDNGFGTYEICVCCGFEFGADDFPDKETAYKNWREEWIGNGCKWFSKATKPPKNWSATEKLNNISCEKEK